MNYENEIYKINNNLYIISWFNFLKIEYDITLSEKNNFITNCERKHYKYIDNEDIGKYNFNDLVYDNEVGKYKILSKRENVFPYALLNIDYIDELLYKNENNEWFLLKNISYDTNMSVRCQQGEYREYKIELSKSEVHDLVLKRDLSKPLKYKEIFDSHKKFFSHKETTYEKVEINKNYDDPILNILFSNKFPLYFYKTNECTSADDTTDITSFTVDIKMIELIGNKKKVILKYNNKEYYYAHISFRICCGSGTDSFIQLDNKEDMEYFDYINFEKDEKMQKHFDYLRGEESE